MPDPDRQPDADPRPWERPGAVRRDAAPHRAYLLATLGRLPLAFGLLSLSSGTWRNRRAWSRRSLTRLPWSAVARGGSASRRRRSDPRPARRSYQTLPPAQHGRAFKDDPPGKDG
jgi:hypothetical protein